jgi:hypothetical protein
MVRAINPNETYPWTLPDEEQLPPDHPDRSEFELRPLPAKHVRKLTNRLMRVDTAKDDGPADVFADAARLAIRGWRNVTASDGSELGCELALETIQGSRETVVRHDVFDLLPPAAAMRIGEHVIGRNCGGLDATDRKNS